MSPKLIQALTRSIFILSFIVSFNFQSNAQVEVKVNYIGALLDLYTVAFEIPVTKNFGLETELIFSDNGGEIGGGILLHGKYYF